MQLAKIILNVGTLALTAMQAAATISWSIDNNNQCSEMAITLSGGVAPYFMDFLPLGDVNEAGPFTVQIPAGASQPYYHQMPWPENTYGVIGVYDNSTSYADSNTNTFYVGGGTSSACLVQDADDKDDFYFSISTSSPPQCSSMDISWTSNFTAPAFVTGYIIGGEMFDIYYGSATSISWPVALAAGTEFVISMNDLGTTGWGGNTQVLTVASGATSCMNTAASVTTTYSSTAVSTTTQHSSTAASSSAMTVSTSPVPTTPVASAHKTNVAAIAGGAGGGAAALIGLVALVFFLRRRSRRASQAYAANLTGDQYTEKMAYMPPTATETPYTVPQTGAPTYSAPINHGSYTIRSD